MAAQCNRENMKKWIDALRSGEYSQARGQLKDGDSYCCLGVLAVVAGKEFVKEPKGYAGGMEGYYDASANAWEGYSAGKDLVVDFLGIDLHEQAAEANVGSGSWSPPCNVLLKRDGSVFATDANDDLRWSFEQIAVALRKRFGID